MVRERIDCPDNEHDWALHGYSGKLIELGSDYDRAVAEMLKLSDSTIECNWCGKVVEHPSNVTVPDYVPVDIPADPWYTDTSQESEPPF